MSEQPEFRNFSPEQEQEVEDWLKANLPELYRQIEEDPFGGNIVDDIYSMYFKLKSFKADIPKNAFIIGIDYKDKEKVKTGEEKININFQNPHPPGEADMFVKDVLLSLITR